MTAAQRWGAAYMTCGLSKRGDVLTGLDLADCYVGRHRKPEAPFGSGYRR